MESVAVKYWLNIFAVVSLAAVIAVFISCSFSAWFQAPLKGKQRFDKVRPGMTKAETVALMEGTDVQFRPSGANIGKPPSICFRPPRLLPSVKRTSYTFYVLLDENDVVVDKDLHAYTTELLP
jgi:hypothetical protein